MDTLHSLHRTRQNHAGFFQTTQERCRKFFAGFSKRRGMTNTTIGWSNEAPSKIERKMKTRNLLLTIGAVALTAITINATASDALLSPRAAGNQIKHVSGTNNDVNLVNTTGVTLSPRAAANRIVTVAGTSSGVNPATFCSQHMTGSSPKAIQACAANPLASMACCAVATTK